MPAPPATRPAALRRPSARTARPPSSRAARPAQATPAACFVHLSFEGPDRYSSAGGLAVRVTNLTRTLARRGAPVHLYFVGDPDEPGIEDRDGVTLHRWCQHISAEARAGVYDAEERKIEDLCVWLPGHLAGVVAAERACGRRTVVLAEDWQTAWPLIAVHDELVARGLRAAAVLAWTANNRFGFERIDFARLGRAATLLTVSRAMKHVLWRHGVNPLVVPNGIPDELIDGPTVTGGRGRARLAGDRLVLAKVARWDPDKRWLMAVEAVARLRDRGDGALFLVRGWNGSASAVAHHRELRTRAHQLGLPWTVCEDAGSAAALTAAVRAAAPDRSGVVELASHLGPEQLRVLYGAADAVLANSGFEPFGLVGLEAMAARGLVVAGSTGEDYVAPFHNGFALDTDDPREIVRCLDWVRRDPRRDEALRSAARETARRYRWTDVTERLLLALGLDAGR